MGLPDPDTWHFMALKAMLPGQLEELTVISSSRSFIYLSPYRAFLLLTACLRTPTLTQLPL